MREDVARLRALLSMSAVTGRLENVGLLAYRSSAGFLGGQRFEALTKAFCDGLQICVGRSFNRNHPCWNQDLTRELNAGVPGLIFKHILVSGKQDSTSLWITLTPETAWLTGWTVSQLHRVLETVKRCARAMWHFDDQSVELIELTKVDVTMDFKGSFLPVDRD